MQQPVISDAKETVLEIIRLYETLTEEILDTDWSDDKQQSLLKLAGGSYEVSIISKWNPRTVTLFLSKLLALSMERAESLSVLQQMHVDYLKSILSAKARLRIAGQSRHEKARDRRVPPEITRILQVSSGLEDYLTCVQKHNRSEAGMQPTIMDWARYPRSQDPTEDLAHLPSQPNDDSCKTEERIPIIDLLDLIPGEEMPDNVDLFAKTVTRLDELFKFLIDRGEGRVPGAYQYDEDDSPGLSTDPTRSSNERHVRFDVDYA